MLVHALCLRRLGNRLTADELRANTPMLGNLRLDDDTIHGRGKSMVLLMPVGNSVEPSVQLHNARVRKVDRRGIIIQGVEEVWLRKKSTQYRQALWCWPVRPDDLRVAAPDPVDVEEEAQHLDEELRR